MMRLSRPLALVAIVAVVAACSHRTDLRKSSSQDDFGVQMAKMNLWREAMFRFQRAVEINPEDAMAHNNLAVAYEANGDFDKARKEYLEALRLDRTNQYIQKNYSRYVEFLSRNRKRQQQKDVKAAAAPTQPAPAQASAVVPPTTTAPPVVDVSQPAPTSTQPPTETTPPQPKPPGGGR